MKHISNLVPSMLNVKTQASSNCFGSFWTKKNLSLFWNYCFAWRS